VPVELHKLRSSELCQLLNSTPIGEVINERQLRRHRACAGTALGRSTKSVDLLRYIAWLAQVRHLSKPGSAITSANLDLFEAAEGAAALSLSQVDEESGGPVPRGKVKSNVRSKQEVMLAALLIEPNHLAAATKVGVNYATLCRWLRKPEFREAYRRARRELVEYAIGRMQAAAGQAVDTLLEVARNGRNERVRVQAAIALLQRACRGLEDANTLHGEPAVKDTTPMNTSDVVSVLATRLRQLDQAELPTSEKSRITATLADSLLRALGVDVLDKRLEALQTVLLNRVETQ
jgi:hypothetical protein